MIVVQGYCCFQPQRLTDHHLLRKITITTSYRTTNQIRMHFMVICSIDEINVKQVKIYNSKTTTKQQVLMIASTNDSINFFGSSFTREQVNMGNKLLWILYPNNSAFRYREAVSSSEQLLSGVEAAQVWNRSATSAWSVAALCFVCL